MADNTAFSWVPGTTCSERYSKLAADNGKQLFEPMGHNRMALVPGPTGIREPSFSTDWGWSSNLVKSAPLPAPALAKDATKELSGPTWVDRYPANISLADLSPGFSSSVQSFLKAIQDASGTYYIIETRISPERAYLMHWAWEIANGKISAQEVDEQHPMANVAIQWDHGDSQASMAAAEKMNRLYRSRFHSLSVLNHVNGNAIDMRISGLVGKKIKKKDGQSVEIKTDTAKLDPMELAPVGASYGVYHLPGDPLHWSVDGH